MTTSKSTTRKTLAFYWRSAWHYPRYVIVLFIAIPITVLVTNFLPPLVLANVLGRLSNHDYVPHQVWASFGGDLVLYALLVMSGGTLLWRIVDYHIWRLEGNVERDIARKIFNHLLHQSADFHANNFGGSLVSQSNKMLSAYVQLANTTWFQIIPLISSLLFVSVILANRAGLFVLLLLLFSIFYIVTAWFVTAPGRRLGHAHAQAESVQTGYLADAITNVMTIKSFARSRYEAERFGKVTDITYARLTTLTSVMQRQQVYFGVTTSMISALSLTMAVIGVVTLNANLATVFLILNYTANIVGQLFQFSNITLRNYNRALGDAAEMTETLDAPATIVDSASPEPLRIKDGTIEFKNVTFQHNGANDALFTDLSLAIKNGEKIGLVGQSGSGKTTLTRLLLRFSDIDGGTIEIDGQNIAKIRQDDLHGQIAYVPQEPLLFHRTIAENIGYGKLNASEQAIEHAAEQAHAAEFVRDLPHRYDTLVGERGVKLSGGQRQRIAIARAMLKDAPILVLDEATSALDSESEVLIQDALWKLMEGRTAIVIAHRLSTIQKMDRIIVLQDGKIIEQGSHQSLLKHKGGTYAKLWAHQSGGFIQE